MKPKKKEFREPVTKPVTVYVREVDGELGNQYFSGHNAAKCRIIREKDYQRLLKAARRKVR
jgi:hypothetical protein